MSNFIISTLRAGSRVTASASTYQKEKYTIDQYKEKTVKKSKLSEPVTSVENGLSRGIMNTFPLLK